MPSRQPFKAELTAFRDSRKPARFKKGEVVKLMGAADLQLLDLVEEESGNRNTTDLRIIERWINHPDRETDWEIIRRAAPDLPAAEFIKEVLGARRKAVSHVNRMYGAGSHLTGFQEEWNALRKKALSAGVLAAANALYIRAYRFLADEYQPSRQDIRGSRLLRLFSDIVGDYLHEKCGRWLDVQTAHLAEIALGLEPRTASPKTISDARRPRSKKAD
jgi:hypothetical protein